MVVIAHHRSVKNNSPFSRSAPAPDGCESSPVAYGPHREFTLDSPVSQSIHPVWSHLADLIRDVVPSGHDHIRSKIADQLLIGAGRVSNDPKPILFR